VTLPTPSPRATRAVVADPPGQPTTLTLYDDAGALGAIILGPGDAVALASDLLLTARLRFGRAHEAMPGPRIEAEKNLMAP
jgi:ethanolamine utilization microcompartment shell protein EutS